MNKIWTNFRTRVAITAINKFTLFVEIHLVTWLCFDTDFINPIYFSIAIDSVAVNLKLIIYFIIIAVKFS